MLKAVAVGDAGHVFAACARFGKTLTLNRDILALGLIGRRNGLGVCLLRVADLAGLQAQGPGFFNGHFFRHVLDHAATGQMVFCSRRCFVNGLGLA